MTPVTRDEVRFPSGDTTCAAWHYPGENGGCVVMAAGTGVTKEPGTDRFAARFQAAGFSVLALDFRHFGQSGGAPRQVVRVAEQLGDYDAAIAFAGRLPEVDPGRVAIWGFSLAGGHVLRVAARHPGLAAAIAQAPLADGPAIGPNAMRAMTPGAALRLQAAGLLDVAGRRLGRAPRLIPLAGSRGEVASITTPDAAQGAAVLDPDGTYPDWEQTVAAGSALRLAFYRPARSAGKIACPLLVLAFDDDRSVLPAPAAKAARAAPRGELARFPGDHYAAFKEAHEDVVDAEVAFLRAHMVAGLPIDATAATVA
jgi:pimeloyl-ACP methyl ester carboxylesterase